MPSDDDDDDDLTPTDVQRTLIELADFKGQPVDLSEWAASLPVGDGIALVCGNCRHEARFFPAPAIADEFEIVSISCPICGAQIRFPSG